MKIGIITLPPSFNYGNILQAFALQTILKRMGHDVDIIVAENRYFKLPFFKRPFVYAKRFFLKYVKCQRNRLVFEENARHVMFQYTENFIRKHLSLKIFSSYRQIKSTDYDAYVVGSDQVWRKKYNKNLYDKYLGFAEKWDVTKIAYAASFGVDYWEYSVDETERCKALMKKFNAISVREESGVSLVRENFCLDASWVLDPTLLLQKDEYVSFFDVESFPPNDGSLFCYLLTFTSSIEEKVKWLSKKENLTPFHVYANFDNRNLPLKERIQPPLEKWLRGFLDAKLVLTDSFHATVFAIIFQKPFILLSSSQRGNSRMESLLKMVGFDVSDGILEKIFIPSERTQAILEQHKKQSLEFLKQYF